MDQGSSSREIDRFLSEVERRAFVVAEIATRDSEEALDLVQDSMIAFVRRYASRPGSEWGALFHRILQNRIRDWHRRRAVRNRWTGWLVRKPPEDEDRPDPIQEMRDPRGREPLKILAGEAAAEALVAAVGELPLRQQQAFLYRTWEGMDVAGTAKVMGCSEGSVKTHLSRALAALRVKLEGYRP